MKRKITDLLRLASIFMMGLVLATSCSETSDDIDDDPATGGDELADLITIDQLTFTLTADSFLTDSENYIEITGESDAAWSASSSATWLDLSAKSGEAGDIEIIVSPNGTNDTASDRSATITFSADGSNSVEVTITQEKAADVETEVSFEIGETDIDAAGGDISATITSNVSWTAASDKDWVSVKSSGSASSDAVSLEIEVSENLTTDTRSATVTVTYDGEIEEIDINQAAAAASMVVTKTDTDFTDMSGGGASATFTVLSNVAWTATPSNDWVTLDVAEGVASTSEVTVKVTVGTNPSETDPRTASITITGTGVNTQTISISQTKFSLSAELETLLAIKATLEGSGSSLNWSEDEENWDGVTSVDGSVTAIELPSKGLAGTIPSEIGSFPSLVTLDLSGNNLTGNLPSEIGNLTEMTTFKVSMNQLSGDVPCDVVTPNYPLWDAMTNVFPQQGSTDITDPTNLALKLHDVGILRVMYYSMDGANWICSTGVTEPEWLNDEPTLTAGMMCISHIAASGRLQGIGGNITGGMLGDMPIEVSMVGTSLAQLRFNNAGSITGTLDAALLKNIKYFLFNGNQIEMTIEDLFSKLTITTIKEIQIGANKLTGTNGIPSSILTAADLGTGFNIPSNGLSGEISAEIKTFLMEKMGDTDGTIFTTKVLTGNDFTVEGE